MILVAALAAGAITWAAAPVVIRALERRSVLDRPNERSSHERPTVRGAGIAPAAGATVGAVAAVSAGVDVAAVAVTALALGSVGLRDDLRSLSAGVRLVLQFMIAAVASLWLLGDNNGEVPFALLAIGGCLFVVGYVNAFNFMDGINGISVAQTAVAGLSWALVGWWHDIPSVTAAGLTVATAAVAFAPYNFPSARAFLGDVGSYFLGAWLGATALLGLFEGLTLEMAVAPLAIYLADTGSTLAKRAIRGERLTAAHRDHVYQRLVINGWSHTRTTLTTGAAMGCCAAFGALSHTESTFARGLGIVGIVLAVAAYLAAPALQSPAQQRNIGPTVT